GLTRSDFSKHMLKCEGRMKIDFTRGLPPESVAASIVRSLRKNKTETILGRDARWILRVNKFFPRLVDWLVARRVRKLYQGEKSEIRISKSETNSKSEIRKQEQTQETAVPKG